MIVCRTLSRLLSNVAMSSPQGRRDISGRSPTKIEADEIDVSPLHGSPRKLSGERRNEPTGSSARSMKHQGSPIRSRPAIGMRRNTPWATAPRCPKNSHAQSTMNSEVVRSNRGGRKRKRRATAGMTISCTDNGTNLASRLLLPSSRRARLAGSARPQQEREDCQMKHRAIIPTLASLALLALGASGAQAQQATMTFFLTSAGPGKGADLGGIEGAGRPCQQLAQAGRAGGN